jgi:hypothetical protein
MRQIHFEHPVSSIQLVAPWCSVQRHFKLSADAERGGQQIGGAQMSSSEIMKPDRDGAHLERPLTGCGKMEVNIIYDLPHPEEAGTAVSVRRETGKE